MHCAKGSCLEALSSSTASAHFDIHCSFFLIAVISKVEPQRTNIPPISHKEKLRHKGPKNPSLSQLAPDAVVLYP